MNDERHTSLPEQLIRLQLTVRLRARLGAQDDGGDGSDGSDGSALGRSTWTPEGRVARR